VNPALDLARPRERGRELRQRGRRQQLLVGPGALHEFVQGALGAIVDRHGVAAALDVEGQVLAHDCHTDDADICLRLSAHSWSFGRPVLWPDRGAGATTGAEDAQDAQDETAT
jgi:hypothetical protein